MGTHRIPRDLASAKDTAADQRTAIKTHRVPHTDLTVSRIAYGCAMLGGNWDKEPLSSDAVARAVRAINTAYECGITLYDLADHYGLGKSEAALGEVLKQSPGLRNRIVIQSKCGVRLWDEPQPGDPLRNDSSYEHIVSAAEGSLRRLHTDHLDILLLHLPDALMEPEEVAKAFEELERSGKVRYFGVSNHTPAQIELLRRNVRQHLVVNQIHLGLLHSYLIADGMEIMLEGAKSLRMANRQKGGATLKWDHSYMAVAGSGTLEYCRLHDIQIQAYSPLRGDLLNPPVDAGSEIKEAAQVVADLAKKKDTTPPAVALAWLLRHPAGIVPVIGATTAAHVIENCAAERVILSREEWYTLFTAAAGIQSRFLF